MNKDNALKTQVRFWSKVDRRGPDDCWLWAGGRVGKSSEYGSFGMGKTTIRAHRYAYKLLVGEIPDTLVLDHLCRVPLCVNPAHLEPVTNRVNIMRGNSPTALNKQKTHCKRGHELSGDNLIIKRGSGHRGCRTCKCATVNARRAVVRREQGYTKPTPLARYNSAKDQLAAAEALLREAGDRFRALEEDAANRSASLELAGVHNTAQAYATIARDHREMAAKISTYLKDGR